MKMENVFKYIPVEINQEINIHLSKSYFFCIFEVLNYSKNASTLYVGII